LTGFYMSRQVFLVFFGKARWGEADAATGEAEQSAAGVTDGGGETSTHAEDEKAAPVAQAVASSAAATPSGAGHGGHDVHPHESPWQMTLPLIVLAGLAAVGGALDLPILSRLLYLDHWLEPVVRFGEVELEDTTNTKLILAGLALLGALIGIFLAARVYLRGKGTRAKIEAPVLAHGWYIDSSIAAFVAGPGTRFFDAVAWFDKTIIDGAVNGIATLVRGSGDRIRRLQTGYVRNYALGVAVGAVLLVGALLSRAAF
jgi:NADH-quinone oxidoreductase subunit L